MYNKVYYENILGLYKEMLINMFKIEEIIEGGDTKYIKRYISVSKENDYEVEIDFPKVTINRNGYDYILIYNKNMNVIREAYNYINKKMEDCSINTREMIASTIKKLYCFMEIFHVDITEFDESKVNMLKDFLYGGSKKTNEGYEYVFQTLRGSDTINNYLSIYRGYLKFLGIENKAFNDKSVIRVEKGSEGLSAHGTTKAYERYSVSEKSSQNKKTVPMYIRPYEFEKIIDVIKRDYSLREEIIVRLMYENGMRIGEALGITLEDIEEDRIIIRNRLSDKADQHAKTCKKVKDKSEYKGTDYNKWKIGYQFVKPTYRLLDIINEYIDIAHGEMSQIKRKNYLNYAKADKVTDGKMLEGENFYLFLNKNGHSLHSDGWNKILRDIYKKIGCVVDSKIREHNLNHRLRHGFGMRRVGEGANVLQLAEDLRHSGISTVQCYFRPTEEDVYNANKEGAENMIKAFPALNHINSKD